jgi:small ligand-binding sensory domain FIST
MPFSSALSLHPVTAHAVGEAVGDVLEGLGPEPDLAVLFVTPPHAGALEDAGNVVRSVLRPGALVGCAAVSVVGTGQEVEQDPAVSLWAGRFGPVQAVRLEAVTTGSAVEITGWPEEIPFDPQALLLLADPFTFPVEALYSELAERHPGLPVVGGNASAAVGPGGNRLLVDQTLVSAGAVGVFLGPGVSVDTVVSQGCRPVGQPYVVTRAEGNVVFELGGEPAMERLVTMAQNSMSSEEV